MGNVIRDPRFRRPKVPPRALLDAQIQFLADECASRTELLEGLPHVFAKLVESCAQAPSRAKPLAVLCVP